MKRSKLEFRKALAQPGILILAVLLLVAAVILALKQRPAPVDRPITGENIQQEVGLPETMLAKALAEGKPTVAFYHSNSCDSCIQMIKVVRQVYGEFVNSVVLVDVNVYQEYNQPLVQRERISFIPSMVFYNAAGQSKRFVGVMQPDQFRDQLLEISAGK